jgi:CubicO group peptidase (beta-lactamase class C family)
VHGAGFGGFGGALAADVEMVVDRIFGPLGMTDTGFVFPPGTEDRATTYHRRSPPTRTGRTLPDASRGVEPARWLLLGLPVGNEGVGVAVTQTMLGLQ